MLMSSKQQNSGDEFGKVAVLMGGDSAEREISILTGNAIYDALRRRGVDAYRFDTGERPLQDLVVEHFEYAFIALHGRGGEDGTIQGALDYLGIPYTGSGVLGSALAMDKVRAKQIWLARGLPTPDFIEIKRESDLEKVVTKLGFPVVIKPVNEGSSVGASKVKKSDELEAAWGKAYSLDHRVMAEKWIVGAEYTAAVLEDRVLPMIRLETPREFYDYEAKYIEETTRYICPCGLDPARETELAKIVMAAFDALGATGWGRVDFMMDTQDQPWLIELNTVPGMTSHSLVPMAARQAGMDFDELVSRILQTCKEYSADGSMTAR
jgi:D-alanine-D-alanine ligase